MADQLLSGPGFEPASGGAAKQLIVFLHGRGANGDDLIGLAPILAEQFPDAAFLSPDAPLRLEGFPSGLQWFDSSNRDPEYMAAGVRAAAPALDAFLDHHLNRLGLGDQDLAIFGFSQGCRMALHAGLRRAQAPAAILGFSGSLAAPGSLAAEITARPPVLLVHGDADDIVPYASLAEAKAALRAVDVPVTAITRPGLGHGIDNEGLGHAMVQLKGVFGASSA